jgi:hypothetical protein
LGGVIAVLLDFIIATGVGACILLMVAGGVDAAVGDKVIMRVNGVDDVLHEFPVFVDAGGSGAGNVATDTHVIQFGVDLGQIGQPTIKIVGFAALIVRVGGNPR